MRIRDLDLGCDELFWRTCEEELGESNKLLINKSAYAIVESYREGTRALRLTTKNLVKVFVGLVPITRRDLVHYDESPTILGVGYITVPFPFVRFLEASRQARRNIILRALHRGMLAAADAFGFDGSQLESIRLAIARNGCVYRRTLGRPIWNRTRTSWAQLAIFGDLDVGQTQLYVFCKSTSEIRGMCLVRNDYLNFDSLSEKWEPSWTGESVASVWATKASHIKRKQRKCIVRGVQYDAMIRIGTVDRGWQGTPETFVRQLSGFHRVT